MTSLLDLRRLRYFVAVAEELHFGRAAKRLGMSQPPLSLQIQNLERELGTALFDRVRQRVHLTAAGRLLLERGQKILADAEAARTDVGLMANGRAGDLRLGFTASSGLMPFLHRALHRFRQEQPSIRLILQEMPSIMQLEAIEAHALDLGIVRYTPQRPRAGLDIELLCEDVLVVAVHVSNPLASKRSLRMKDLRSQSFIAYPRGSGIGIAHKLYELTSEAGFHPEIVQEARDSSTIIGLVAAGLGVGIVPAALACIRMEGVRFVALRDASARSAIYSVRRSQATSVPVAKMHELLLDTVTGTGSRRQAIGTSALG